MENLPPEFVIRAERARDQLIAQFIYDPDVTMIDVGYEPGKEMTADNIILRIHVRQRWMNARKEERTAFPAEVEGIRVVVLPGEYKLE